MKMKPLLACTVWTAWAKYLCLVVVMMLHFQIPFNSLLNPPCCCEKSGLSDWEAVWQPPLLRCRSVRGCLQLPSKSKSLIMALHVTHQTGKHSPNPNEHNLEDATKVGQNRQKFERCEETDGCLDTQLTSFSQTPNWRRSRIDWMCLRLPGRYFLHILSINMQRMSGNQSFNAIRTESGHRLSPSDCPHFFIILMTRRLWGCRV